MRAHERNLLWVNGMRPNSNLIYHVQLIMNFLMKYLPSRRDENKQKEQLNQSRNCFCLFFKNFKLLCKFALFADRALVGGENQKCEKSRTRERRGFDGGISFLALWSDLSVLTHLHQRELLSAGRESFYKAACARKANLISQKAEIFLMTFHCFSAFGAIRWEAAGNVAT